MQRELGDNVQIISVCGEELDVVKKAMSANSGGSNFRELTKDHCVAADPDGSIANLFRGISVPSQYAIIVGENGKIVWIGNKDSKEVAIKSTLSGSFDAKFVENQLYTLDVRNLASRNKLSSKRFDEFVERNLNNANDLNLIAWTIWERVESHGDVKRHILKRALKCAKRAVAVAPEDGNILDTYAHFIFKVEDDVERAIEIQKLAVSKSPENENIRNYLTTLQDYKARHWTNSIGMKMVRIPAGVFSMGGSPINEERWQKETFVHEVEITKPFFFGTTEVTQGQWTSVMQTKPWTNANGTPKKNVRLGADYPASFISWTDAKEFCQKLSQKENRVYRLPTEAEWEYSCRAGTNTIFFFGDDFDHLDDFAWYLKNSGSGFSDYDAATSFAHKVGSKRSNPWGLYDMCGNVSELCEDFSDPEYYKNSPRRDPVNLTRSKGTTDEGGESFYDTSWRVSRGGSAFRDSMDCMSAHRSIGDPKRGSQSDGFRVVCELRPHELP